MKIRIPGLDGFIGYSAANGIRSWMSTMRYEAHLEDPLADPILALGGPKIFVIWHESMLAPIYLRAHCRIAILISRHRDADLLASIARNAGFGCVRGSTNKGGSQALHELAEYSQENHIVFTPDGPLGPRRVMAPGPVILAMRTGLPIVPIALGYSNAWNLNTWDQFVVPKPFSNVRVWMGREIYVDMNLNREEVESARQHVEAELNRCTLMAEEWATDKRVPAYSHRVYRHQNRNRIAPRLERQRKAA